MTSEEQPRVLSLAGIHNFRDYGGYSARAGKLRRSMLWRSGQHAEATADDLALVQDLKIATVIDLRGDSERRGSPCLRHSEFCGQVVFHPGETATATGGATGLAVHEEAARDVRTVADARLAMNRLYRTLPYRPVLIGTFRLYFKALADRAGPSLLHCLAGKDRTGLAAALLHDLLGVHRDDVMADYLLTNTAGNAEARIAAGARHVRAGFGKDMEDAAVRVLMGVEAQFLDSAFAAIHESHGSTGRYAADVLGITPATIAALERNLIAS